MKIERFIAGNAEVLKLDRTVIGIFPYDRYSDAKQRADKAEKKLMELVRRPLPSSNYP